MKQTYIANVLDAAGKNITFERFACKRAATVKRQMLQLFQNDLYRVCTRGAAMVEVYATPDGYTKEAAPEIVFDV